MDNPGLCLDTGVLIAYLKDREPGATAVERAVKSYRCYITAITAYELLFGVAWARKEIGEETLLDVMTVLPIDNLVARRAAALHVELIRRNQDIGIKDVLIAAVCLEASLPLLTTNTRHFSRVPGMEVVIPTELLGAVKTL